MVRARYKLVNNTPCYVPPDMDIFFLPFHLGNQLGGLAELKLSDPQKEKLRQIGREYMKQKREAHERAEKDWQKLSPAEREARSKEMRATYLAVERVFGKRLDEVLTPEQLAKVKNAMLQNEAYGDLMEILRNPRMDERLQLRLSDGQKQQLTKLFSDREKKQAQATRDYPDRLMEVLSPRQREKLLEGIDESAAGLCAPASRLVIASHLYFGGAKRSSRPVCLLVLFVKRRLGRRLCRKQYFR